MKTKKKKKIPPSVVGFLTQELNTTWVLAHYMNNVLTLNPGDSKVKETFFTMLSLLLLFFF